jgi:hypothetical protein
VFDSNYGKCFAFNISDNQQVAGAGLSLVLNLDIENAVRRANDMAQYNMSQDDGVILKVETPFGHYFLSYYHESKRKTFDFQGNFLSHFNNPTPDEKVQKCKPVLIKRDKRANMIWLHIFGVQSLNYKH